MKQDYFPPKRKFVLGSLNKTLAYASLSDILVK